MPTPQPDREPSPESGLEPGVESDLESDLESVAESSLESVAESGVEPGLESVAESRLEPHPDTAGPGRGFDLDERASLALCVSNPAGFDTSTVLEFLVRADAEQHRWAAARARLLAELSRRDPSADRWVAEEVGAALRLSPARAMAEVKNATQLHDALPATFDRLAAGELTATQAKLVTEASYRLPDTAAVGLLDEQAAARCGDLSEPQTRRLLRRQVLRADPTGAERRHTQAMQDRYVRLTEAEDGMALLTAFLPAPQAVACMQRLDQAARHHRQLTRTGTDTDSGTPADPRTLDQLRADLFTHTLLAHTPLKHAPLTHADHGTEVHDTRDPDGAHAASCGACKGGSAAGLGASIQVIVSAATLLGQDEEPGWLDRYGPISAETARRVAHDPTGTWRRILTDPASGQVTDIGTRRYRPPDPIRRRVVMRDGTCRFPYCTHPATGSDLDHAIPYPDGPTAVTNLHAVSRRHHRAKTEGRWQVSLDPDTATTTWTSPLGRSYLTRPPQRWTYPDDQPVRPGQNPDGGGSKSSNEIDDKDPPPF